MQLLPIFAQSSIIAADNHMQWYANPLFLAPIFGLLGAVVAGLITAFVALRVTKLNQSHDYKKERLRRRRDLLEYVAERFEDFESKMGAAAAAYGKIARGGGPKNAELVIADEATQAQTSAELLEAEERLFKLKSRLALEQFAQCEVALYELIIATGKFKISDNAVDSAETKKGWDLACRKFQDSLVGTYQALRSHPDPL
jgi:hypothetical protein